MKLLKNMLNNVDLARETFYYFMNMNGVVSCGFNLIKRKHELTEIQQKNKL